MQAESELMKLNWEELQASLYRYCLALTRSEWEAQDLTQTAWTKTLSRLQKLGHVNPEALLLRTAKNAWIDGCRRKAAYQELLDGMLRREVTQPDGDRLDLEHILDSIMKHLSPLQRTVFVLREAFGYSIAETAQGLGTTEGAIKAALHRARQAMGQVRKDLVQTDTDMPDIQVKKASNEMEEQVSQAADALREGRVEELVTLLYDGYFWQTTVYAVGSFQASTSIQTYSSFTTTNSGLMLRMAA